MVVPNAPDVRRSVFALAEWPYSGGLDLLRLSSRDDFSLRKFVEKIKSSDAETEALSKQPRPTGARLAMVNALERGLDMTGRSGKEVLIEMLAVRYDLKPNDFVDKPAELMGALRALLGSSCRVLEVEMLRSIKEETGVSARTIEEAAHQVKKWEASQ